MQISERMRRIFTVAKRIDQNRREKQQPTPTPKPTPKPK